MTKPIFLGATIAAVFVIADLLWGYTVVFRIGHGLFVILALVISGTFLWLWVRRSTPLALGMAFGWAGAASITAWWWVRNLLDRPDWMRESPVLLLCLSLYLVGAILHLEVIGRSFSLSRVTTFAPVYAAIVLSVMIALYV